MAVPKPVNVDAHFIDYLEHFAGARTNPYAIQVARQICTNFKLSVNGQRRLNRALNDLPCLDTSDDRLWFGWSYEHIIRSPRAHQTAYEHLAIVITLAECFHETYAAEVFNEMAKAALPPAQTAPHIYQWIDLLHYCNGILASDDFGLLVESFINLDPYSVTPGSKYSADHCLVPAKSFAIALLAFSELTCGNRKRLTFRGGAVVAFLAALAESFYDIKVSIESAEGVHLYGSQVDASLVIVYMNKPEIHVDGDTAPSSSRQRTSSISVPAYSARIHFLPFGGRLAWQNVLPQVFGDRFRALDHEHSQRMYVAIGCAFRALEGVPVMAETTTTENSSGTPELAHPPPQISAAQRIASLTAYFPSLQKGASKLERQLRHSPEDAAQVYTDHMDELVSACNCIICSDHLDPSTTSSRQEQAETEIASYCLPCIVETIICLSLMLSRIVLAIPIFPNREGIQLLYKRRTERRRHQLQHHHHQNQHNQHQHHHHHSNKPHTPPTLSLPPPTPSHLAALYDHIPTAPTATLLRMTVKLFGGGHLPRLGTNALPHGLVALSHDGICAFAAELAAGRAEVKRGMRGMVRVVPGGFGVGLKTYRVGVWGVERPGGREAWLWEEVELEYLREEEGRGRLWCK